MGCGAPGPANRSTSTGCLEAVTVQSFVDPASATVPAAAAGTTQIDEGLYSRQLGAYGHETMGKLMQLRVLIVGLAGIGSETAKDLILAGPNAVHVHDDTPVHISDLGVNCFLTVDAIGKSRSSASVSKLAELNPYVDVRAHSGALTPELIRQYSVVVYTNSDPGIDTQAEMKSINAFCRTQQPAIGFIAANVLGASGFVFVDFGSEFVVHDPDGENAKVLVVQSISQESNALVTVCEERHGLVSGAYVTFEELEGVDELNQLPTPVQIAEVPGHRNQFRIPIDTRSTVRPYIRGGIVNQVKVPQRKAFSSFAESLIRPVPAGLPGLLVTDFGKFGRAEQLHYAYQAIWAFQSENAAGNHALPRLHNDEDAARCIELARQILAGTRSVIEASGAADQNSGPSAVSVDEIDEQVVRHLAHYAQCSLSGLSAFFGGVVAQEVVKFTGKFTPIRQWLYADAFEVLMPTPPQFQPPAGSGIPSFPHTRYDHRIAMFGREFQERLHRLRVFLVGAGALGCEFVKMLSLLGIGTSANSDGSGGRAVGGAVYITDMDHIELSNLSRQFLFRRDDIGHPKSEAAARAGRVMNDAVQWTTFTTAVGKDSENVFTSPFWESLDVVINALDNVDARRYTDGQCVLYGKPLLESGTTGTRANAEVFIPHLTNSYSDHHDVEQDAIPMCTLRNFPYLIEHCIEWGRDRFQKLFSNGPGDLNMFLKDPMEFLSAIEEESSVFIRLERLELLQRLLNLRTNPSAGSCIAFAQEVFLTDFRDTIVDLVTQFPEGSRQRDKDTGEDQGPFWTGHKRFPIAAPTLDPTDPLHVEFVLSAAAILAHVFQAPDARQVFVPANASASATETFGPLLQNYLHQNPSRAYRPGASVNLYDDPSAGKVESEASSANDARLTPEAAASKYQALLQEMYAVDVDSIAPLVPEEFEKDDDSNHHIDFITACSNLRARNYRIKQSSRHQCKMIAGRIIPALATTTAMITGLVEIELLKTLIQPALDLSSYRLYNCNLALGEDLILNSWEPVSVDRNRSTFRISVNPKMNRGVSVQSSNIDVTVADFVRTVNKALASSPSLSQDSVDSLVAIEYLSGTDASTGLEVMTAIWSACSVQSDGLDPADGSRLLRHLLAAVGSPTVVYLKLASSHTLNAHVDGPVLAIPEGWEKWSNGQLQVSGQTAWGQVLEKICTAYSPAVVRMVHVSGLSTLLYNREPKAHELVGGWQQRINQKYTALKKVVQDKIDAAEQAGVVNLDSLYDEKVSLNSKMFDEIKSVQMAKSVPFDMSVYASKLNQPLRSVLADAQLKHADTCSTILFEIDAAMSTGERCVVPPCCIRFVQ